MSGAELVGRVVWIEPDRDRSAIAFSPRKAIILDVIDTPTEKEAALIELAPPALVWHPFPQKLTHILLRYMHDDDDSIQRTFRIGLSVSDVYKLKRKVNFADRSLNKSGMSRLGIAIVRPWPIPSAAELRERISADRRQRTESLS